MEEWGGRAFDRSTHLATPSLVSGPVNGSNQGHTSRSIPSRRSASSIPSKATRSVRYVREQRFTLALKL